MKLIPVEVECYAGGQAAERPRRIRVCGAEFVVARLLSSSIELTPASTQPSRRFRVLTEDGKQFDLRLTPDGQWLLELPPGDIDPAFDQDRS